VSNTDLPPAAPVPASAEATRMFAEAGEASAVAARQLARNAAAVACAWAQRLRGRAAARWCSTCARGSSDHAATFAKYLIETVIGVPVTASAAPSVVSVYHATPRARRHAAAGDLAIGPSPDLLSTVEAGKAGGAGSPRWSMTPGIAARRAGRYAAAAPCRAEKSVAATKSYIAALAAIVGLVAAWTEDDALSAALDAAPALLAEVLAGSTGHRGRRPRADAHGLYVIGRGLGLGVAQEAALKFKETCGLHAEAFSAAEVRHGPMALIGPDFPGAVFRPGRRNRAGRRDLVREALGQDRCRLLRWPAAYRARSPCRRSMPRRRSSRCSRSRASTAMVNALSVRRGFDPDRPPAFAQSDETV
jgi:glucosamine--fructose-6-phosphate aminotransferase (isomerizing)